MINYSLVKLCLLYHLFVFQSKQAKGVEGETGSSPAELPRVVKNECVDRFWQAMEAYCRPITDEDIKYLEEQLRKHDDEDATYFKIPPLGRHFREVWAEEDLLEEMAEGGRLFTCH